MEDNHGGARKGAGRKPKADEEKVALTFTTALKELYNVDTDDEAKSKFVKESLLKSQRGQLFIAEHLFGKPKETLDTTVTLNDFNIKDVIQFDKL